MIRRLIEFIFGKPSVREQRIARQIRRMFEDAKKEGYEVVVESGSIYRRRKE